MNKAPERILVIRRDNIGDLVCTTPLLSALRRHFPDAWLAALVNSYNAPVLQGNPDLDAVFVYRKFKHAGGESRWRVWWETLRLILRLRAMKIDVLIVATPAWTPSALKFARWIKPARVICFGQQGEDAGDRLAMRPAEVWHETQAVMHLLTPLGINEAPGPARVFPEAARQALVALPPGEGPLIGVHISARKPSQRWPAEAFAQLVRRLHDERGARFLLFWAPGSEDNKLHPGDDGKARALLAACRDLPLQPCPTVELPELIAGLACCDAIVCSDGGAMHLAAGLGKPILCFFGNSGAAHWRPWGVEHQLLQPASLNVPDISVDEAVDRFNALMQDVHDKAGRP